MWKELCGQNEIEELLEGFGYFHDSCLKEVLIHSNSFVNNELSMSVDPTAVAYLVFQRQFNVGYSVIEMKFEEVEQFCLNPCPKNYDAIIFSATIFQIEDTFYWSNDEEFSPEEIKITKWLHWISAKKVMWRALDNALGDSKRYRSES
ncbi:hypothetical protein [Solibacillus sp. FSL H8-0538]|uniref:hypothetical protein n=1 Tax=Solibacillus sp. FSL H8-0538 TaxID=2921400 RepID=UPI0030F74BD2